MTTPVPIHQFLPTLNPGDAIGNVTRAMRDAIRALGHPSEIFAENVDPSLTGEAHRYQDYPHFEDPRNVILYHYSVASVLSEFLRLTWERKVLIYHNVTPPHFYDGLEPHIRAVLSRSEDELKSLVPVTDLAVGDSGFNCAELERFGFRDPQVLPILLDLHKLEREMDGDTLIDESGAEHRILFVGKLGPNKRFEDLMVCFEHYRRTRDPKAKLVLIGGSFSPLYEERLRALKHKLGPDSIVLKGAVSQGVLNAYYRKAALFLCLSDHEGYCVPLVECMYLGLPVVAYRHPGVEWTLGGSGVLLDRKDPETVAAAMEHVLTDAAFRKQVVDGQKKRLEELSPTRVKARLAEILDRVLALPVRKPRIAFVVQRYGAEVSGGSEAHCRLVAEHLRDKAEVEVLTTTALDYETWRDHFPAGPAEVNGVRVERFPVLATRELASFSVQSERFFAEPVRTIADEARWIVEQGPFAPALVDAVSERFDRVDAFVFFTYLYYPTVLGLLRAGHKGLLVPTAHDEVPFHFRAVQTALKRAAGMIFNTEEERALIEGTQGGARGIGIITGVGIEEPEGYSAARFRERTGIERPFLLYVGRISAAKGCLQILDFYSVMRASWPEAPELVFIGKGDIDLEGRPGVHALGFVQEEREKFDALAAAIALVNPSPMESLSMVLLEAWLAGTPTLANAACPALVGQSRRSKAGLWYGSYEEFEALVRLLAGDAELRARLGRAGREFVRGHYHWDLIVHKYLVALRYLALDARAPAAEAA